MVIRSITVESFGTLSGPVTIELDDRLNVICGPNEAGKSTLMRAVWFAFTRKAGSQAAEIKQVNPRTGGTPYVKIEFQREGTSYELEKEFSPPNGMTKLLVESPDGQISEFTDDEADDEVGRVLGFGKPTGRTKTPAHYGMWPATWMDQHERSVDPGTRLAADGDKEGLSELLARATGHVLAGAEGEGLVEKAKAEYDRYYTKSGSETTKSGAPLHEARKALEEAEDAQQELLDRQGSYEDDLRRYASLKEEQDALKEELPKLRDREKEAKERKQKANELTGKLATHKERLKTQEGRVEKLESEQERRARLREDIEKATKEIAKQKEEFEEARKNLTTHDEKRDTLIQERDRAEAARDEARQVVELLDAHESVLAQSERKEALTLKLGTAQERQQALAAKKAELEGIKLTEEDAEHLQELKDERVAASAALESASARVEIKALRDVSMAWQQEELDLSAGETKEQFIDTVQRIRIDDVVELEIEPGGENLADLRKRKEEAEEAFSEALANYHVASLTEARKLLRKKSDLESTVENLKQLLNEVAPEGVQALREAASLAAQELETSLPRRDELREHLEVELPEEQDELQRELEAAKSDAEEAARAFDAAKETVHAHDQERERLQKSVELAEQAYGSAKDRVEERSQELDERIEAEGSDEELGESLSQARAERDETKSTTKRLESELSDLRADTIDLDIERAETALEQADKEYQQKRDDLIKLETRLGSVELHGLHEKLEKAQAEVDEAEQEVRRWEQKAKAARLLYETLEETRREVEREFLAPLRDEAEDLLSQFFSSTDLSIRLGSDFSVTELTRRSNGSFEPDNLSFGAREQVALILRLAMARLLAKEEPHPVFLDEALTDTDDERFEVMANILQQVARDVQIVVTTCHKNRFRRMGAQKLIDLDRQYAAIPNG